MMIDHKFFDRFFVLRTFSWAEFDECNEEGPRNISACTKIYHNIRDPKKWYRSVKNTIFHGYIMNRTFPTNIFCMLNRSSSKGWENICDRLAKMQTNGLDIGNIQNFKFMILRLN